MDINTTLFSVIIPVFNPTSFLLEAIKSVYQQENLLNANIEILLIDDASDNAISKDLIQEISQK